MERAKAVAERYSKAVGEIDAIKKELHGVIIDFLIENGLRLKRCTETGLSQSLGLPRSSIRAALAELESENIITPLEAFGTKPYVLDSKGFFVALEKGLIQMDKKRIERILSTKDTSDLADYVPEEPLAFGFALSRGKAPDGRIKTRYLTPTDVNIVYGFVSVFYELFPKTKGEQTYLDATQQLRIMEAEFLPQVAVFDELTSRLNWEEGRTAEEMRQAHISKREKGLSTVTYRLRLFADMVEQKGYGNAVKELPDKMDSSRKTIKGEREDELKSPKFSRYRETAWAVITMVRNSLPMLKRMGVSQKFIKEFEEEAQRLERLLSKQD